VATRHAKSVRHALQATFSRNLNPPALSRWSSTACPPPAIPAGSLSDFPPTAETLVDHYYVAVAVYNRKY
jgi:hypothetical protein